MCVQLNYTENAVIDLLYFIIIIMYVFSFTYLKIPDTSNDEKNIPYIFLHLVSLFDINTWIKQYIFIV